MDIFVEYIVKKKYALKDIAFIAGILFLTLFIIVALIKIDISILRLGSLTFILIAAVLFGDYLILSAQSKEFEYSITNGEMDIDLIIAKRKRKHLLSAKTRLIELCANVHDPEFEHALKNKKTSSKTIMAASHMKANQTYFADLIGHDDKNYRLYFEPTAKMLDALKKYNPQNVHIYECKEKVT